MWVGSALQSTLARPCAEPVRLAVLIGHEHNIAHIERLLNLAWEIPGFQANEVSPGSALAFELFREPSTGQRYVRLAFFAQTPEQMSRATVLTIGGASPRTTPSREFTPAGRRIRSTPSVK